MAENVINARIQNPYDTVANWQQSTKILLAGELAFDETKKFKIGDGLHKWSELSYPPSAGAGEENVQPDWDETDITSDAYIHNKPEIPTLLSSLENDTGYISYTTDSTFEELEV